MRQQHHLFAQADKPAYSVYSDLSALRASDTQTTPVSNFSSHSMGDQQFSRASGGHVPVIPSRTPAHSTGEDPCSLCNAQLSAFEQ
eukprot:1162131-Pelagomonas_calceolata.AAC.16